MPMDSTIINTVVNIFVVTLDGAYASLQFYSLGLLAAFAALHFYLAMFPALMSGSPLAPGLAVFVQTLLKVGVFYWLATRLYDLMWNGMFYTFLGWGMAAGRGAFGYEQFLRPGNIVDVGFKAAIPLYDVVVNLSGWGVLFSWPTMAGFVFAYWLVVLAFGILAIHVVMAIIEIKAAIATGAILIPWGVFAHTAFLAEISMAWLAAGFVRVLLTATVMSIAVPLFESVRFQGASPLAQLLLGGDDPQLHQAATMVVLALLFVVMAWCVPQRAAAMGGRGMALALSGGDVVAGGMTVWGAARSGGSRAVQGVSAMRARFP